MSAPLTTAAPSASSKSGNIVATRIFIDEVPEYGSMSKCAETEVSTIVRNMNYGCGDGSRMTSYACFCYSSSVKFDSMIGSRVGTACDDQSQRTLAQDVFSQYCQLGATRLVVPTGVSASTTFAAQSTSSSPASSSTSSGLAVDSSTSTTRAISSAASSSIPTPSSLSNTSDSTPNRTTTIAVAVSVPILVIILLVASFLFYRYRKHSQAAAAAKNIVADMSWNRDEGHGVPSMVDAMSPVELSADKKEPYVSELPVEKSRLSFAELPGHEAMDRRQIR